MNVAKVRASECSKGLNQVNVAKVTASECSKG